MLCTLSHSAYRNSNRRCNSELKRCLLYSMSHLQYDPIIPIHSNWFEFHMFDSLFYVRASQLLIFFLFYCDNQSEVLNRIHIIVIHVFGNASCLLMLHEDQADYLFSLLYVFSFRISFPTLFRWWIFWIQIMRISLFCSQ